MPKIFLFINCLIYNYEHYNCLTLNFSIQFILFSPQIVANLAITSFVPFNIMSHEQIVWSFGTKNLKTARRAE
jgi:hypothetical protein